MPSLSRLVVPFCTYYMDSGQISEARRIKEAVFVLFYYSAAVFLVPGILLYYWLEKGTLTEANTPQFIIASTNS